MEITASNIDKLGRLGGSLEKQIETSAHSHNYFYFPGYLANIGRPHGAALRRQVMMGAPS